VFRIDAEDDGLGEAVGASEELSQVFGNGFGAVTPVSAKGEYKRVSILEQQRTTKNCGWGPGLEIKTGSDGGYLGRG
jgi:hypothetical protein